jgi:guanylate kinase
MSKDKKNDGKLIVISAPSGGGKGTVIKRILELRPDLCYSVSATTRTPRDGEVDGEAYHFKSKEQFIQMIENNEFLEHAKYVDEYYGTPKQYIIESVKNGKNIILEIEVQGAKQVMDLMPEALTIFIVPPSLEELENRLRGRGTDSEEKLLKRLKTAELELDEKENYSFIVVNDEVDRAAKEILSIVEEKE